MNSDDFDGTLVLEKLNEIGKVDDFFDAIDADDFQEAGKLMKMARIDLDTVEAVIEKMRQADGEH